MQKRFFYFCVLCFVFRSSDNNEDPCIQRLRGIAQHGGTVRDQQEVDGTAEHQQVGRRGLADIRAHVLEVQLASTGHVQVSAGLVGTRVQAEVQHQRTLVLGGVDVAASKGEWQVVAVEG